MNEDIRAREIRLIGADGQQEGIMPLREAQRVAYEQNLDLVEIAPTAIPPVCKIMDFGKHKYQQSKREREARKNQKVVNIKEVKLRLGIEEHDFQVKARSAGRFLTSGDKVKVTIMFRGREISHPDLGRALCDKMTQALSGISVVERPPRIEGRNMFMIFTPRQNIAQLQKPIAENNTGGVFDQVGAAEYRPE